MVPRIRIQPWKTFPRAQLYRCPLNAIAVPAWGTKDLGGVLGGEENNQDKRRCVLGLGGGGRRAVVMWCWQVLVPTCVL